MKVRELKQDEPLQIGDIITTKHAFGRGSYIVNRLTKKFAFAKVNDTTECKFPNTYKWNFCSLPKDTWSTTEYKAYRKI